MARPCVNGCPFYGTPQTDNLCSACFRLANANSTCSNSKCPKGASSSASNLAAAVASSSAAAPPVVKTPVATPVPSSPAPTTPPPLSPPPSTSISAAAAAAAAAAAPTSSNTKATSPFIVTAQPPPPPPRSTTFEPQVVPKPPSPSPSQQQQHQALPRPPTPTASSSPVNNAQSTASPNDARPGAPSNNRCFVCRKKLGLTPFVCRCNRSFCPKHRLSTAHDCEFDYKAQHRDILSRSNPAVLAKKVDKI